MFGCQQQTWPTTYKDDSVIFLTLTRILSSFSWRIEHNQEWEMKNLFSFYLRLIAISFMVPQCELWILSENGLFWEFCGVLINKNPNLILSLWQLISWLITHILIFFSVVSMSFSKLNIITVLPCFFITFSVHDSYRWLCNLKKSLINVRLLYNHVWNMFAFHLWSERVVTNVMLYLLQMKQNFRL